jgi:GntR family transcriptional regulator, carbon starvation induced regulator
LTHVKFFAQFCKMSTKSEQKTLHPPAVDEVGPPLSEMAYRALRADILRGSIEPGSKLKIDELQQRYQYSSSPLREALNRLAAEQFVVADERRGFRAARTSLADLRDITKFRIVLERSAFEEAISQGTDEWEAGIISALHRLEALQNVLPRDTRSLDDVWIERHKNFHLALIAACGSSRLLAACSAMFDHSQRYRTLWALRRSAPRNAAPEHRRLADAALRRDKKAGAELLAEHIQRTADQVAKFLD